MNNIYNWKRYAFAAAFIILAGFSSCKKSEAEATGEPSTGGENENPTASERANLTKDSIFYYAKEVYLWNEALPTYDAFKPRSYIGTDEIKSYEKELFAITRFGTNPQTQRPYEYSGSNTYPKYSYISDLNEKNPVAVIAPKGSVDTDGNGYDFGFYSFAALGTDADYRLFVKAIYPGSPAADKEFNLTRGAEITSIEGKRIGSNFAKEVDLINSLLENTMPSVMLKGVRKDGSSFDFTIERDAYTSSPVYKSKVFEVNGKKVGYINLGRFSQLTSPEDSNPSDNNLDPVFASFASEGLTDLIVDLRYNGGGYVSTAEYLINLIAPSSASGVMYTEHYNKLMQSNKANILKNQPLTNADGTIRYGSDNKMLTYANVDYSVEKNTATFKKKGGLTGIKNVVFIVTGNTASASELTINALKPFLNVKLVGQTTYGKPVGFFPVTLENRYDVYFSMFETLNSKKEGGYYAGMKPDIVDAIDDVKRDFDDASENYIAKSLALLAPGPATNARASMSVKGSNGVSLSLSPTLMEKIKTPTKFIGMIETRHKIK